MDGTSNLSVTLNLPTPKYWRHLPQLTPSLPFEYLCVL